jgi:nucleotide-binding universal stress UspA family protein
MNKILLPVDFSSTSLRVVHQAAFLARHFHSEIILLHVVAPMSYPVGTVEIGYELTGDLHAEIMKRAQRDLDQSLRSELRAGHLEVRNFERDSIAIFDRIPMTSASLRSVAA